MLFIFYSQPKFSFLSNELGTSDNEVMKNFYLLHPLQKFKSSSSLSSCSVHSPSSSSSSNPPLPQSSSSSSSLNPPLPLPLWILLCILLLCILLFLLFLKSSSSSSSSNPPLPFLLQILLSLLLLKFHLSSSSSPFDHTTYFSFLSSSSYIAVIVVASLSLWTIKIYFLYYLAFYHSAICHLP